MRRLGKTCINNFSIRRYSLNRTRVRAILLYRHTFHHIAEYFFSVFRYSFRSIDDGATLHDQLIAGSSFCAERLLIHNISPSLAPDTFHMPRLIVLLGK